MAKKKAAKKRAVTKRGVKEAPTKKRPAPKPTKKKVKASDAATKKKVATKKKTVAKKKAVVIKKAAKRAAVKKKAVTKPKTARTIAARMSSLATMTSPVAPPEPPRPDPIKHVVVLMFENHSFDQMLGCFHSAGAEGVDPANPRSNKDSTGDEYFQRESNDPVVSPDPKHELEHILNQLKDDNSGFVSEYEKEYARKNPDLQRIMDYFGMGDLPALHELARHFTICDHWFSSVPGPTWTNRFFVHSGTSLGRVKMPGGMIPNPLLYAGYVQDTIYDRLDEKGIPWTIYHGDVPQSLVLSHQQRGPNLLRYEWLDRFDMDAGGPETRLSSIRLHRAELLPHPVRAAAERRSPAAFNDPGAGASRQGLQRPAEQRRPLELYLAGRALRRTWRVLRPC